MHSNVFSAVGYDLRDLESKINQKPDKHEIYSIHHTLDSLKNSIEGLWTEVNGLSSKLQEMEQNQLKLTERLNENESH